MLKHSELVQRRYILSGSPAPNNPFEYHPQITFLDSSILGKSFYKFRLQYGYQTGYMGYKWVMTKEKQDLLMEKIKPISIFIKKEECLDLPEQIHTKRIVSWLSPQKKFYDDMLYNYICMFKEGAVTAQNVVTQMMKLRQITSGFIYLPDGSSKYIGGKKLNELKAVLEEIGNHQVIIWAHFKEEIKQIAKELNCPFYSGDTPEKEKFNILNDFKEGKYKYLVAHPASIGHGITLTNCHYAIYYSMSHSYELLTQSQQRIHRIGQKEKCQYFYLLVEDSIDMEIYKAVENKERIEQRLLEMLR